MNIECALPEMKNEKLECRNGGNGRRGGRRPGEEIAERQKLARRDDAACSKRLFL